MPYSQPIFEKNWIFRVNQSILLGSNASLIYEMKESLKFGNWTVVKSSNGSSVSTSDLWTSASAIVPPSSMLSWVVLRNTSIDTVNAKFDICLTLSSDFVFSFYIAPLGYDELTGSTSARPSTLNANDEASYSGNLSTYEDLKMHCMQSTDGECTRILITQFDSVIILLMIDKIKTSLTSQQFAIPYVISFHGSGLTASYVPGNTYYGSTIATTPITTAIARPLSDNNRYFYISLGTENTGLYYNSFSNKLVVPGLQAHSSYAGWNGKVGDFYDLWVAPGYLPSGVTFPSDNSKNFTVIFGKTSSAYVRCIIIPWNGTTPSFQL